MTLNHLLLATDGSKSAQKVEDFAFQLSGNYGAKLTIVYALDDSLCHYGEVDTLAPLEARESFISYVIDEQKEVADKLAKALLEKAAKNNNAKYELKVRQGEPLDVIAAIAKEENVDVILVGGKRLKKSRGFKILTLSDKLGSQTDQNILTIV